MLRGYHAAWGQTQDQYKVICCETERQLPLHAPDGRRTRFRLAGKIDKVVSVQGDETGVVIVDHKTTSSDLSTEGFYWRQLQTDTQGLHYQLLMSAMEDPVVDIIWDVVRKPSIRPQRQETPRAYGQRVIRWFNSQRTPAFARRSQMRLGNELEDYYAELYLESRDILHARRQGFWRKNPQACMSYGRQCPYLGICSGIDSPDDASWQHGQRHAELSGNMKGDLLTHSRMSCFRLCPRRHLFKYELGLKKDQADDSEALRFGTAWHTLMDAYWTGGTSEASDVRA